MKAELIENLKHVRYLMGLKNNTKECEVLLDKAIQALTSVKTNEDYEKQREIVKQRLSYHFGGTDGEWNIKGMNAPFMKEFLNTIQKLISMPIVTSVKSESAEKWWNDNEILLCKLIGEASMCWTKEPSGEYDDKRAHRLLVKLKEVIIQAMHSFANAEKKQHEIVGELLQEIEQARNKYQVLNNQYVVSIYVLDAIIQEFKNKINI